MAKLKVGDIVEVTEQADWAGSAWHHTILVVVSDEGRHDGTVTCNFITYPPSVWHNPAYVCLDDNLAEVCRVVGRAEP